MTTPHNDQSTTEALIRAALHDRARVTSVATSRTAFERHRRNAVRR
jgi:hypothetical protein